MRLIDADATIKEIKARNPDDVSYEDAWAITCIEHAPTIEPERTGKWIEYDNSHCECPFCHEEWSYFDNEVEYFNYCPNCGARMESEA